MTLRTIRATRYVTPLREGGSLPAIVEADDDGLYVLKFRGAGQGARALVAETIAAGVARALDLPMPEPVLLRLDPVLARTEPDPEIQDLIRASAGINFGLDYLAGAANFDPVADPVDPALASRIVWFDALLNNVDRSARNTNLLTWHHRLYLIDHGACLYFHHGWDGDGARATREFPQIREHVLLPRAAVLAQVDAALAAVLDRACLEAILAQVPDAWLDLPDAFAPPAQQRAAYVEYLLRRLAAPRRFVQEAIDVRA
jgi:hypothetical protein